MKSILLAAVFLALGVSSTLKAYDIPGATPISKLEDTRKKAIAQKKLVTVVFRGSNTSCPHCKDAAAAGVQAVRASSYLVLLDEKDAKSSDAMEKLPEGVKTALRQRMSGGAWVAFHVFDPELTKEVAYADRNSLDNNPKGTNAFAKAVRDARKEVK